MTTEKLTTLPPPILYPESERISDPHTIDLERPVKHGSESLEAITFQPLSGLHVRQLKFDGEMGPDEYLTLAGKLTGLPDSVFDQLTADDVGQVLGACQGLIWPAIDLLNVTRDPETGEPDTCDLPRLAAPFELKLERPLKSDRQTVETLKFREVTGREARAFPAGNLAVHKIPGLIRKLTGVEPSIVDKLTGIDLRNALGVAQCFFGSIRATGRGSGVLSL